MTKDEWNNRKGRSSSWITKHKRLAIYLRDKFTCMYCGKDLHAVPRREVTLDHLKCREFGGTNHEANLVTTCLSCNSARGSRQLWYRYATGGAVKRIRATVRKRLPIDLSKAILSGDTHLVDAVESLR